MKQILTLLSALAVTASFAVAADEAAKAEKPKKDPEAAFKKLDTNADGSITAEEWKASPAAQRDAAKAEKAWTRRDKDKDGKLTLEEYKGKSKSAEADKPE